MIKSFHELLNLPVIHPYLTDITSPTQQPGKNYTHDSGIGTPSKEKDRGLRWHHMNEGGCKLDTKYFKEKM
jgi:hypothetical protein